MSKTLASLLQSRVILGSLLAVVVVASATGAAAATVAALTVVSGANQQTTYAAAFPDSFTVSVTDAATHRALAGVRVNYTPATGIRLDSTFAVTDEHGIARVNAIGIAPGSSMVSAEVAGSPNARVRFEGLVVNKATLTVLPSDLQSMGGMAPEVASYSIQGFVHGDTLESAQITGAPELSTTATVDSHYGNYAIKGGVGTLSAPNYTFVAGFGTLAISLAPDASNPQGPSVAGNRDLMVVRLALGKDVSTIQPFFVAGGDNGSNLSVRAAVMLKAPAGTTIEHASIAPATLPVAVADGNPGGFASVRVALARSEPVSATSVVHANIAPAALPGVVSDLHNDSGAPVRAAMVLNVTAVSTAGPSSFSGLAIRKALIIPGTNQPGTN